MLDDFGDETLLEELEESVFGSEDSERYLAADGVEMEAPQSDADGDDDLELEDFGDED